MCVSRYVYEHLEQISRESSYFAQTEVTPSSWYYQIPLMLRGAVLHRKV